MPRPYVERVAFSIRLRASTHAALRAKAKREGISINEAVEAAVIAWTGKPQPRKPPANVRRVRAASQSRTQVQPRFKGKP